jgi:hypothetical protein
MVIGDNMPNDAAHRFDMAMMSIYHCARAEVNYNAARFLQGNFGDVRSQSALWQMGWVTGRHRDVEEKDRN